MLKKNLFCTPYILLELVLASGNEKPVIIVNPEKKAAFCLTGRLTILYWPCCICQRTLLKIWMCVKRTWQVVGDQLLDCTLSCVVEPVDSILEQSQLDSLIKLPGIDQIVSHANYLRVTPIEAKKKPGKPLKIYKPWIGAEGLAL